MYLDFKSDESAEWQSLYVSYVTNSFGPADVRFMMEFLKWDQ